MSSFKKGAVEIFRPIAAVTRCGGIGSNGDSREIQCTTNIFRSKGRGFSKAIDPSCSTDESIVLSFPAEAWPPHDIPGSESAESKITTERRKQNIGRSVLLKNESDESGTPHRLASSKEPPSYYKIEMQGSVVQLTAGDDNSVRIDSHHNERLKQAGSKSSDLTRAAPIEERSQDSPEKRHCVGAGQKCRWSVSENGRITNIPEPPHLPQLTENHNEANSGMLKKTELSKKLGTKGGDLNLDPPLLAKVSTDSLSSASSHEFLPRSPPRMTRTALISSLFQEDASRSTGSKQSYSKASSKKHRSSVSSISTNSVPGGKGCGARFDVISQLIDFFSLNCCQTTVCKRSRPTSPETGSVAAN